jgi:tRNA threonylcarbamoyladenosine biosynthesis protein TsaB
MNVIAIDCALEECQVAVLAGGEVRSRLSEAMARGQAERIAPMAREAMAQARLAFTDIDRIVATTGPGSFTGVRVGLAFARGLAVALSRPCVGVSTLEALALADGANGLRGALIGAAGACYGALYEDGAVLMPPRRFEDCEDAQSTFARAAEGRRMVVAGPGAGVLGAAGADIRIIAAPDPAALARLGASRDPRIAPPHPHYLRAALA